MLFPQRGLGGGNAKPKHTVFVFIWILKYTKKCASGIPITFGKSLKKQEIKAQQIKSCGRFPVPEEAALKKINSNTLLSSPVFLSARRLPTTNFIALLTVVFKGDGFTLHKVQTEVY